MTKFSASDAKQMRRALALAEKGRGLVEPNPLVGAVLARRGEIVGEGWHRAFGEPHAEAEAIRDAGGKRGDTLYVNLEPCHHQGKTPPCTEAISAAGVRRVVIGMRDPNRDVVGGGAASLRSRGLAVDEGCLEEESHRLNAPFEKRVTERLPYVTAKWAMSLDGRLATRTGESKWISSEESRRMVHDLRGEVDAILVGVGTALKDDPRLDCRSTPKRIAKRFVADSGARTPPGCRMLTEEGGGEVTIVATGAAPKERIAALERAGARVWLQPSAGERVDLRDLLFRIGEEGATHLLVEGGPTILGSLFREGLVDRVLCFIAPKILGGEAHAISGWGADRILGVSSLENVRVGHPGGDLLIEGTLPRKRNR